MSEQPFQTLTLEPTTDLIIIEDLDFDAELPCERKFCVAHNGPGALFVRNRPCSKCGDTSIGDFVCCQPCWENAWSKGLRCSACNTVMTRDEGWALLRYLK